MFCQLIVVLLLRVDTTGGGVASLTPLAVFAVASFLSNVAVLTMLRDAGAASTSFTSTVCKALVILVSYALFPKPVAPAQVAGMQRHQRWQRFLDEEVTPRFPDGFSVLDVYGQWQRRETGAIERLNSKLLVILFQGPQHRADLDALRAAWKQRTGDQSVLLTISPAEVSF